MRRKHQPERPVFALAALLLATVLIPPPMPVGAADIPFPIDTRSLVEVRSIEAFPEDVRKALGRQKSGAQGIADKWDKVNARGSTNNQLPVRRFITGGVGPSSALVAYEQGGGGTSAQAAAFSLERSGWVKVGQWTLHEKTYSLHGLLELVDSKHYPEGANWKRRAILSERMKKTRPFRRDGPLRELNVTDEEVLEIKSATLRIYPGSLVNISGVVTGCPCEEGLACSDQVWIVTHRPGLMKGLQLSRINGHWAVGIVQQWWLNFEKVEGIRTTSPRAYDKAIQNLYDSFPACANDPTGSTQGSASQTPC